MHDASEPARVKEKSQLLSGPWEFGVRVVIQGEGHRGGGLKDERWRDGHHPSPFPRAAAWLLGFCQSGSLAIGVLSKQGSLPEW